MCAQRLIQAGMLEIPAEVVDFCRLSDRTEVTLGALDERSILMHVRGRGVDAEMRRLLARCPWKSGPLRLVRRGERLYLLVPEELVVRYSLWERGVKFVAVTPHRVGLVVTRAPESGR